MRVQRRVLRAVWLQVVGTRAGFGRRPNASCLLFARKLCPTILPSESMLVPYRPLGIIIGAFALDLIEPYRCPATRGVGREVSGQASKKGLRERGAATTRQNRGGQIS